MKRPSPIELVIHYLAERARPRVLVPLAAVLAGAGWLIGSGEHWSTSRFLAATANAFLLVLALRVWDDLEDRRRDVREHPQRVMVQDGRTVPFVALALLLGVAGTWVVVLSAHAGPRMAVLMATVAILAVWYRVRGDRRGVIGWHVVLMKYPAIALALAPVLPAWNAPFALWRGAAILMGLYLGLCVYEAFEDPALRGSRVAQRLALVELVLLVPSILGAFTFFQLGKP
jgi:4-hydroxybenzoate polyprenyltransferase